MYVIRHLSKLIECTTPRVSSNVKSEFFGGYLVVMYIHQWKKFTSLVGDIDIGRSYACV